jgi:hypothetical protein
MYQVWSKDFDQTWYILSPYDSLELYWFSRSKVKGLIFTLWTQSNNKIWTNILCVNCTWPKVFHGQDFIRFWKYHYVTSLHGFLWDRQWILVKLGTYLVLKRIWNPIDLQGHRSRSPDQIFRRGGRTKWPSPTTCHFENIWIKSKPCGQCTPPLCV